MNFLGNSQQCVGVCTSTNKAKTLGDAFDMALKGAISDATKRALRKFGDALGNSLYHPSYVKAHRDYLRRQSQERVKKAQEQYKRQQAFLSSAQAKRRIEYNISEVPTKVQKTCSSPSERTDNDVTTRTTSTTETAQQQQDSTTRVPDSAEKTTASCDDVVATKSDHDVSSKQQDDEEYFDDDDDIFSDIGSLSQADMLRLCE